MTKGRIKQKKEIIFCRWNYFNNKNDLDNSMNIKKVPIDINNICHSTSKMSLWFE